MLKKLVHHEGSYVMKGQSKAFLLITIFICINLLSACNSDKTVVQEFEEYKIQNEELKLKIIELDKTIQSYKDIEKDNLQKIDFLEKSRTSVMDVLDVKVINGTYYIVLGTYGNTTSNVQLWKYTGVPFATLSEEGIHIEIETRDSFLYCKVIKDVGNDKYIDEVIKFDKDNNKNLIYEGDRSDYLCFKS